MDTNKRMYLLVNQHEMSHITGPAYKPLLSNGGMLTRCQTNKYFGQSVKKNLAKKNTSAVNDESNQGKINKRKM